MPSSLHGPMHEGAGATLRVWAPRAPALWVRHGGRAIPMARAQDGFFVCPERLPEGASYAYQFPDGRTLPDPCSRRQRDGVHAASQLFDPRRHEWTDEGWRGLPLEELVFYELHVGTFTHEGTLGAAASRLEDLVELGVSCVELMPLQPFAGARNWGYDGVCPFAVHEAYGGPAALQRFVDRAHALGLAVCLDVVYNHLGPEGNYLGEFGPYFSSAHHTPWGEGLNLDGESSAPVRRYIVEAAVQWVRDFHVDVLRLDAVHAFADDSLRHIVRELCDEVAACASLCGRRVHVIAESDLNDRQVVESGGGWGCSAMWADDFHHALHALVTGERKHYYVDFGRPEQLARALREGFAFQGERSVFRGRPHGTSPSGLPPFRFVAAAQNHDQIGNRPCGERLSALLPFEALQPIAALTILGPALPLLFMGEEYGEERPFLFFTSHSDPALARSVTEGRKREHIARAPEVCDPQSPDSFERSKLSQRRDGRNGRLREEYRSLLRIRRRHLADIAGEWPQVSFEGTLFRLLRPTLEVEVNLSPAPFGGLGPWGVEVRER